MTHACKTLPSPIRYAMRAVKSFLVDSLTSCLSGFDERMLSAGVGPRDMDQMSDSQISGTAITGPVVNKR